MVCFYFKEGILEDLEGGAVCWLSFFRDEILGRAMSWEIEVEVGIVVGVGQVKDGINTTSVLDDV